MNAFRKFIREIEIEVDNELRSKLVAREQVEQEQPEEEYNLKFNDEPGAEQ